ncbi:PAS domain S-box protein [uncultured Methanospirillum sp.]|uniref:PAS domain S-box protein n=1 Tax=uncultured Methanospirillum sp. TaxID=262503 RepID=UPI0029C847FC|nr:PAS domain S-box protein [uncultured Methanospirillum sp.]
MQGYLKRIEAAIQSGPMKISIVYLTIGLLWIFFSDRLAFIIAGPDHDRFLFLSTFKGIGYVFVTAFLLYVLIRHFFLRFSEEQRKAKETLRISESLFRGIFNTMPSGAIIYSAQNDGSRGSDYIVTDINPTALSMEGISREIIIGHPITSIRPEIDDFGLIPIFQKVWTTGETIYYPTTVYPGSTTVHWFENYVFRLPDHQIIAIYNDVTEKMRTAEALSASEERLRLSLEAANDGIWDWNVKTGIVSCNSQWYTQLGYVPGEMPATYDTWRNLIHPEDQQEAEQTILKQISQEDGTFSVELRMKTRQGGWVWILTRGKAVAWDEDKNPIRVVGTHTDISKIKNAELNLIASEGRLHTLIQTIPDLVWLKDINGVYLACNPMFERFIGKKAAEITGKSDYDFFEREIADFFRSNDQKAVDAEGPSVNEEWITFADDGHRAFLETIKTPMYDSDRRLVGVLGIGRDITERNTIHSQNLIQKRRLEQAEAIGHLGSWEFDIRTGTIWGSDEGFRIYGLEPPEGNLLPINEIEACIPERDRVHQALIDLITDDIPYNLEFDINPADGSPQRTIISIAELTKDESGNLVRVTGVIQDITLRKLIEKEREILLDNLAQTNEELNAAYEQLKGSEEELKYQFNTLALTEEHLRETTQYLENLIAFANVPIIVWDPDFLITRINHSCEDLIGRKAEALIGKPIEILFPPDKVEHSMRLLKTTTAGVRWDIVEMDVQHLDGSIRSVIWNSSTIYDATGSHPAATIVQGQDITLKKRLEYENKLSFAEIQKNLAQLAILNDQIRNPLSIILSCIEGLEEHDYIKVLYDQIIRIDDIVTHLDQRWIESEKILTILQKKYNIIASPSAIQAIQTYAREPDDKNRKIRDLLPESAGLLIKEMEAELYTILDSIDAFIFVADYETYDLLYTNKLGRNLFGTSSGKKCYEVIEKDQTGPCPFCRNHLLMDESGPTGIQREEKRNTHNGRWYDSRNQVIRGGDGRLVHLQIATDITERKQTENELRENEYTFRFLFEKSSDPILLMQEDRFIECNQASLDLLQLEDKEQLIGSNPVDFSPEVQPDGRLSSETVAEYIRSAHENGSCRFEWMCLRSDGSPVLLEVSLLSIFFKGERMLHNTWRDITRRKEAEEAILRAKSELKRKLDAILSPGGDIGTLNLADIINIPEIQHLMDDFYSLTKIGVGIIDIQGVVLVATGWQHICTDFHRANPQTCKNCLESDILLSEGVPAGTFRKYRCENNMWDIATPIMVGGVHLGNLFLGQFLFDDEAIDYDIFKAQARLYGFDEKDYISALEQVPRWSKETVDTAMDFYIRLMNLISEVSWNNIRLARMIAERDLRLISGKEGYAGDRTE